MTLPCSLARQHRPKEANVTANSSEDQKKAAEIVSAIDRLFKAYCEDVQARDLSDSTKSMYIDFADYFVCWVKGDGRPGKYGTRNRPKY